MTREGPVWLPWGCRQNCGGAEPIYLEEDETKAAVPPAVLLAPSSLVKWKVSYGTALDVIEDHKFIGERMRKLRKADLRKIAELLTTEPGVDSTASSAAKDAIAVLDGRKSDEDIPSESFYLLFNALQREVRQDTEVFYKSPTLSSKYTTKDAYRLFRLGWLLVALNSSTIKERLSQPAVASWRPSRPLCPTLR